MASCVKEKEFLKKDPVQFSVPITIKVLQCNIKEATTKKSGNSDKETIKRKKGKDWNPKKKGDKFFSNNKKTKQKQNEKRKLTFFISDNKRKFM